MTDTYYRPNRRSDDPEFDSVATDDLDIAGNDLIASGEVLPIASYSPPASRSSGVSNSSFSTDFDLGLFFVDWDSLPAGQKAVGISMGLAAGTDETVTARFFNDTDSEELTSVASAQTSQTPVWSGWEEYTPTTTSGIRVRFEHKTEPGTNSGTSTAPTLQIGMKV